MQRIVAFRCLGIIPAYAGSTHCFVLCLCLLKDHPRIRGVHVLGPLGVVGAVGSSPHTRGPQSIAAAHPVVVRITPAYAGSTGTGLYPARWPWDHPRTRGVHRWWIRGTAAVLGSSPHTRGPPKLFKDLTLEDRFIPAYAGSTSVTS